MKRYDYIVRASEFHYFDPPFDSVLKVVSKTKYVKWVGGEGRNIDKWIVTLRDDNEISEIYKQIWTYINLFLTNPSNSNYKPEQLEDYICAAYKTYDNFNHVVDMVVHDGLPVPDDINDGVYDEVLYRMTAVEEMKHLLLTNSVPLSFPSRSGTVTL